MPEPEGVPGVWFHGRRGEALFEEGVPAFFTSDYQGAKWYAHERGDFGEEPRIYRAHLDIRNPASHDDLLRAVERAGATVEDVAAHSPYDGDNDLDYLYVPTVRDELERMGFDGYQGWDVLTNYEIPIVVAFHSSQVELQGESF